MGTAASTRQQSCHKAPVREDGPELLILSGIHQTRQLPAKAVTSASLAEVLAATDTCGRHPSPPGFFVFSSSLPEVEELLGYCTRAASCIVQSAEPNFL